MNQSHFELSLQVLLLLVAPGTDHKMQAVIKHCMDLCSHIVMT